VADSRQNAAWDIGYYVDALRTVRPVATFNVSSQTNGTVIAVHYAEGQTLHRGDPCLRTWRAQCCRSSGAIQDDRSGRAGLDKGYSKRAQPTLRACTMNLSGALPM